MAQFQPWRRYSTVPASVKYTSEENDAGYEQDCVYATCGQSGLVVGPIWGHSERSVARALATLTEKCSCNARFHEEAA